MRRSPSVLPEAVDQEIYLVLDDDEAETDRGDGDH